MEKQFNYLTGIIITAALAVVAKLCSRLIPYDLISPGVFAMLIGMALFPLVNKLGIPADGLTFVSKKVLKGSIVLMGVTLSFAQVINVGKYSLIVMIFTLSSAFFFGNLFGKLFNMNWKLSNLIAAGTGICGGSAIAAISPTIDADDSDIAYAISATFLFDIVMVVLFPIAGRYLGMSDMGYGLWAGTAVNDTSSVVAAGYAFSDVAGQYATVVKLTRTLSIVPIVMIFAYINQRIKVAESGITGTGTKVSIKKIFPWFILLFLGMVLLRSFADAMAISGGLFSATQISGLAGAASRVSKFAMVMALGAIGLKTDFKKLAKSGLVPMLHGFIISALVVVVSFLVQLLLGQI
ncbi:MAG TPA: putative sulfate exporter family transporter [Clostridia bacterium]|nr:putative sulfate exporter family transporter [Clostridia bacterium]